MYARTLVLDASFVPHREVHWTTAAGLVHKGRAEVVETHDDTIRVIARETAKTLSLHPTMLKWFELGDADPDVFVVRSPSIVRLLNVVGRRRAVRFSRIAVATRDDFRCQYCGQRRMLKHLTFDHVVPRSQGGTTVWENIVMACRKCNGFKADRTPEQAGMTLLARPVKPKWLPLAGLRLDPARDSIPDSWRAFLYWHVELEP